MKNNTIIDTIKKYQNDEDFNNLIDFINDNEEYFDNNIDYCINDIDTLASAIYQLTAYENGFFINVDDFIFDNVKSYIENLEDNEFMNINNNYCNYDNYIYDDLDEALEGLAPYEIANKIHFGNYQGGMIGYYQYNGYANIIEDYPSNMIDIDEVTQNFIDENIAIDDEVKSLLSKITIDLVKQGY